MKKYIWISVMAGFLSNAVSSDLEGFAEKVKETVNFDECTSFSFDPPIEIEVKDKGFSITFSKIYSCNNEDGVFMIANKRESKDIMDKFRHEREDLHYVCEFLKNPNKTDKNSIRINGRGEGFYTQSILVFLGRWDVFLSQDPFPRGGLLIEEQKRLIVEDYLRRGTSTRV